jgi:hypothetical protein
MLDRLVSDGGAYNLNCALALWTQSYQIQSTQTGRVHVDDVTTSGLSPNGFRGSIRAILTMSCARLSICRVKQTRADTVNSRNFVYYLPGRYGDVKIYR